jgi:hypothetical protein
MSTITEALKLEVSIVEALLNRNRTSHGRTLYYKRMQMVMQCIRKCSLLEFVARLEQRMKQSLKKDREWTAGEGDDECDYLTATLSTTFPQLISRIEHAAKAFFVELGRAFFLPYCTVAVAALARIRILVQRMGQESIVEMHKLGVDLTDRLQEYVAEEEGETKSAADTHQLKLLAKSLGVAWKDNGFTQKNEPKEEMSQTAPDDVEPDQPVVQDDPEDIGLHVGLDRKNPVVAEQSERVDHNLQILMDTKKALSMKKKKRKLEGDGGDKKEKTKQSKTKKKKKDFFDDLFGA